MLVIPEYCLGYTKYSGNGHEKEGAPETGHSAFCSQTKLQQWDNLAGLSQRALPALSYLLAIFSFH